MYDAAEGIVWPVAPTGLQAVFLVSCLPCFAQGCLLASVFLLWDLLSSLTSSAPSSSFL